jgi:hypothetical protein
MVPYGLLFLSLFNDLVSTAKVNSRQIRCGVDGLMAVTAFCKILAQQLPGRLRETSIIIGGQQWELNATENDSKLLLHYQLFRWTK